MQPSANARQLVMAAEGLRLTAYPDPGTGAAPWTIGYGSTKGVRAGMQITLAQAEQRLAADLDDAAAVVRGAVTVPLSQNQFDALASFVFNVGAGNFQRSTLLRLLNERNYRAAAKQFNVWTMAGGTVMPGLVKRRASERELFERAV